MTKRQKIWEVFYPFVTILLALSTVSVILLLVAGLLTGLYDPNDIYREVKAIPLLISICAYALTIFLLRKNFRFDQMRFGEDERLSYPHAIISAVFLVLAGLLISFAIRNLGISAVFDGYAADSAAAFEGQNPILLILSTVLLGPIAEEIVFRGMIFRRVRYYLNMKIAAVLSAVLFGLYHGNVLQFLYGTLVGLLIAWQYEKYRNLKLCIATHMCLNVVAILFPFRAV